MTIDLVWPRLCQGVGLRTAPQVQTAMTSEAAGHGAGAWGYIRPEGGVAMAPQRAGTGRSSRDGVSVIP